MKAFPHPWAGVGLGIYQVWQDKPGSVSGSPYTAVAIEADSAKEAAEKWAKKKDAESTEFSIANGERATVCVKCPDATMAYFHVTGESVPTYRATFRGLIYTYRRRPGAGTE